MGRKANTCASRKSKGRRASQGVRDLLLRVGSLFGLREGDIEVKPSGVTGEDLYMSPLARSIYPYVFEVKCQESLNIWSAMDQAKQHAKGTDFIPLTVFKRNNTPHFVALDFESFLKLTIDAEAMPKRAEVPIAAPLS